MIHWRSSLVPTTRPCISACIVSSPPSLSPRVQSTSDSDERKQVSATLIVSQETAMDVFSSGLPGQLFGIGATSGPSIIKLGFNTTNYYRTVTKNLFHGMDWSTLGNCHPIFMSK